MKKAVRFLLLTGNVLSVLALLLTYTSSFVEPLRGWYFPLLGLAYPYLLALNLAWIIFWLFVSRKYAWISLVCIALGWPRPKHVLALPFASDVPEDTPSLRVMSYNVRQFNKYSWKVDRDVLEQIAAFIEKEKPDVLLLQEFFHVSGQPENENLETILNACGLQHYFLERSRSSWDPDNWRTFDLAVFSRYPIVRHDFFLPEQSDKAFAAYADLKVNGDTLRFYNVHFASLRFRRRDVEFLEDVTAEETQSSLEKTRSVVQKIQNAAIKRVYEMQTIRHHLEESPYPVLVGGDFNESAFNYGFSLLQEDMQDGFAKAHDQLGFGFTYEGFGMLPPQRIDFLLASSDWTFHRFETHKIQLSDHEPITASLSWENVR